MLVGFRAILGGLALLVVCGHGAAAAAHLSYGWQEVDGINLFYREGGPKDAPVILFLHGNPSSSIMYEEVMENIADAGDVHVLALDYPSFGYSDAPDHKAYAYTFENIARTTEKFLRARGITKYAVVMQDYGVPVGFHMITANPDAVTAIIVQNGVIHLDGFPTAQDEKGELRQHWLKRNPAVDARRTENIRKTRFPAKPGWGYGPRMSPDALLLMMAAAQRPGVSLARGDLWFDYGTNVRNYPAWQAQLRSLSVPIQVIWGSRDDFFTTPGAMAYLRDAPHAEVHILDGEHFATLETPDEVSALVKDFLARHRKALAGKR